MERELLKSYIRNGLSIAGISKVTQKSKTSVRHWLKKYSLKTQIVKTKLAIHIDGKNCNKCNQYKTIDFFHVKKNGVAATYCKQCTTWQTIERQRKFKLRCVEYKGGKCTQCGYDKCVAAFDFHHLDPSEKEFTIGYFKLYTFDERVKKELDKCILLCSNCHRETHFNQEAK